MRRGGVGAIGLRRARDARCFDDDVAAKRQPLPLGSFGEKRTIARGMIWAQASGREAPVVASVVVAFPLKRLDITHDSRSYPRPCAGSLWRALVAKLSPNITEGVFPSLSNGRAGVRLSRKADG
jgi:hypothetical protein